MSRSSPAYSTLACAHDFDILTPQASSQGPPSFTRRVEIDEVSKMLGDAENSTQNMGKQEDKSKHKDDALEVRHSVHTTKKKKKPFISS